MRTLSFPNSVNLLKQALSLFQYGYVKCKFFAGKDDPGTWTQPNNQESVLKFVLRKSREVFSTNQKTGYAQGQAGYVETF